MRPGHVNVPCLSIAFTSAPRSSRVSRQVSLSDSSPARSKGLLSWIYQVKCTSWTWNAKKTKRRITKTREELNPRLTVASPCLSFQHSLHARPAASPCLACSSTPLCVEDCSKTLGLEGRHTFTLTIWFSITEIQSKKNQLHTLVQPVRQYQSIS